MIQQITEATANSVLAPHQIPPPPRDFTGRDTELNTLLTNFERGATIISLNGMAGIGKTMLARKLAERLADRFTDGQISIDLKGTSSAPLMSADAMLHVIHAYAPTFQRPESESELRGKYFSVLTGRRILLFL